MILKLVWESDRVDFCHKKDRQRNRKRDGSTSPKKWYRGNIEYMLAYREEKVCTYTRNSRKATIIKQKDNAAETSREMKGWNI